MYHKSDVFNLNSSDYELTPMDEKIFNVLGLVLHQADKDEIIYKEYFGSILNQRLCSSHRDGRIEGYRWFLTNSDDKDCEDLELSDNEMELMKQKYDELLKGYWAN